MTELQFNEIKERLAKYREIRHLTYENQRKDFLGNVFEKVSKYFRAKDDLERVEALCDIAVFCFNAFDFKYRAVSSNMNCYTFSDAVIYNIYSLFGARTDNLCLVENENTLYLENHLNLTMFEIEHLCNNLGFDFYKCMLETIKDIESRTGYYDKEKGKFIKNDGACNKEDLLEKYPISKYSISEDNIHFIIFNKKGHTETFIKKWYKADYESCRIEK
ncbi:hypothetical protein ACNF6X_09080 [Campylobacter coli]